MPKKDARERSKSGWKATQNQIKKKRKVKLATLLIGILLAFLLLSEVANLVRSLTRPLNGNTVRSYRWEGKANFNVAVLGQGISVISLNPIQKKVTIISSPDQTYVEVPGGFGKWQLRSVFDLGQTNGEGGRLLEDTLTSFLGIPVEGFIRLKGNLQGWEANDLVNSIRRTPISILTQLKNIDSDLTLGELTQLNLNLFQVRFDKVKTLDLQKLGVLDQGKLPDSTEVFTFESTKLDTILSDLVEDKIKEENLSIAVFNATEHPALAQRAARLITNLGGSVIQISNSPQKQDKTFVSGEKSKTLDRLKQIFAPGCSKKEDCDKITIDLNKISSRAQINVILGEDFFFRFGN